MSLTSQKYVLFVRESGNTTVTRREISYQEARALVQPSNPRSAYELVTRLGLGTTGGDVLVNNVRKAIPKGHARFLREVFLKDGEKIEVGVAYGIAGRKADTAIQTFCAARVRLRLSPGSEAHLSLLSTDGADDDSTSQIYWNKQFDLSYQIAIELDPVPETRPTQPVETNEPAPTTNAVRGGVRPPFRRGTLGDSGVSVALRAARYDPATELALTIHQVDTDVDVGLGASELEVGGQRFPMVRSALDQFDDWAPGGVQLFPYGQKLSLAAFKEGFKGLCQAFHVPLEVAEAAMSAEAPRERITLGKMFWYPHTSSNPVDRVQVTDVELSWPAQSTEPLTPADPV